MITTVKDFAKKDELLKSSSLVIVLMSHGYDGKILGVWSQIQNNKKSKNFAWWLMPNITSRGLNLT